MKRIRIGKKKIKYCAVTVQVILYVCNAAAWALAAFSIGLGLVVGLTTNTIGLDTQILDFLITTPATVFMFYGIALLIPSLLGCFASVSANIWTTIAYIIFIVLFVVFDTTIGIHFLFGSDSYNDFIRSIQNSVHGFGEEKAKRFGIIPLPPSVYWEHFQRRGKCCGLFTYEEWKNTSYAKKSHSIPDSCCNPHYDYEGCGDLAWRHPDHGDHTVLSLIHERSCISIFPEHLQEDSKQTIQYFGKFLASILLLCLVLSVVTIILVQTKYFRPAEGLNNPTFLETPVSPVELPPEERRFFRRIAPAAADAGGDMRVVGDPNGNDAPRSRKISFDESGPRYIPHREQTPNQHQPHAQGAR